MPVPPIPTASGFSEELHGEFDAGLGESLRQARVEDFQLFAEALPGHVQTPLDGAGRHLEVASHLLQAPAAEVERLEREAIERLEPGETDLQLPDRFADRGVFL